MISSLYNEKSENGLHWLLFHLRCMAYLLDSIETFLSRILLTLFWSPNNKFKYGDRTGLLFHCLIRIKPVKDLKIFTRREVS